VNNPIASPINESRINNDYYDNEVNDIKKPEMNARGQYRKVANHHSSY
jgi:hypothetical protein